MIRRSSSRRTPSEAQADLDALFDDIDEIERMLEPLQGAQADSLRTQLEDKRKKLELVDNEEIASFRLAVLRKETSRLRTKAEALANNSISASTSGLHNQLDDIGRSLETIQETDAEALRLQLEDKKNKLGSVDKKELPSLQNEILALKERADYLSTKSFLFNEIGRIENTLVTAKSKPFYKRSEWESLEAEKNEKKARLKSADETELVSLRKEINELKDSAESFADRETWREKLSRVSPFIWLGFIPLIIVIYAGVIAVVQWNNQGIINTYATRTAKAMPTATVTATETLMPVTSPTP